MKIADWDAAARSLDQLLRAYAMGGFGESVAWEDLNAAFDMARTAAPGEYERIVAAMKEDQDASLHSEDGA